jgi:mono/diheme cytochrome c family protein
MRCLYAILTGLAVVLVAVPAPASPGCQPGYCPPAVHHQAVAVAPVVAAFPLYGAGYVGTGYGGDDETRELLRQLLAEMKAMRSELAAGKGPDGTLNSTAGPDVFAILRASCVSCHGGDRPKGDFAMTNEKGEFLRLSPADRRSVLARIDGKGGPVMPPTGKDHKPLTAAEKAAVKAALTDGKPAIPAGKK